MIKVIVTDTNAQNTLDYALDLSAIASGATLRLSQSSSYFYADFRKDGQVAVSSSSSSWLSSFSNGSTIGKSASWYRYGSVSMSSGSSGLFGFRVNQGKGGSDYTYGWFKVTTVSSSAFTLNSYGYNSTLNADAIAGQGNATGVPDSGPGIVGLALLGAGAAGVRLLRKLRAGK